MIVTLRTLFISVSALLVCNMAGLAATDVSSPAESLQTEIEASQVEVEVIKKEMTAEQKRSIQNYNELIDQLQSTGGVYQVQLSEVLLSLGATYQSMELHKNAIDAFERSMHISRVNDGLYSLDQISILEKMIESNTKLKDWKNLNKNFHNLFWISKRHYGENNTELLDVIDRIGRWHLKAYEILPASESFSHLVDAENLYNKAVKIIETTNGQYDIRLINALYGIALTNYQIASRVSGAEDFDDIRMGFRNSDRRRALQQQRAREDLIMQSFAKGKKAMNRIIEIHTANPILPVDTQAIALTHLGDWYLLFNKRNSAATTYQQAYDLLDSEGFDQQKIDVLFGQPRTLPAIRLPIQNQIDIVEENPSYVVASFDVSASGSARNIQILESNPSDNISFQRRAKRSIASTKFRPRYENGKPVITTGVSLRYVFTE
ncbi:MAG: hypothetical protein HN764_12535 [Gammaproteobacteria bacterium]|jgi:hypothetical protein|nr:hypothetical protein [Gammaproteobacteria bacterium]